MKIGFRISWVLLLMGMPILAEEPIRLGEEFQVNSYTTGRQNRPASAFDSLGNFVVVWDSYGSSGTDSSFYSIQGQRFDSSGSPVGGQFQVNSYTTYYQQRPKVAVDSQGNFVVVWDSYGSSGTDTNYFSVQGQRYDAAGALVGGEFQVNSYTTHYQQWPEVAIDPQGNFVVVWNSRGSYGSDASQFSVQGQRYDGTGALVGGEFQVNSYTTNSQLRPTAAFDPQGNFLVVWDSYGSDDSDTDSWSIQGQRYDATGALVGGEIQVNSYTTSSQTNAHVNVDPQGNFVVVWISGGSYGTDTSDSSIQGQRYDATGTPVGGQFQVNSYTTSLQVRPHVALDAQGNFLVVWDSHGSYGSDTDSWSIQGQRFDSSGSPVGGQFQVNSYTTSLQTYSHVALDAQGNFLVVWDSYGSYGSDTDSWSIQGQRFAAPIFCDGFESGDTSVWSNTVQ